MKRRMLTILMSAVLAATLCRVPVLADESTVEAADSVVSSASTDEIVESAASLASTDEVVESANSSDSDAAISAAVSESVESVDDSVAAVSVIDNAIDSLEVSLAAAEGDSDDNALNGAAHTYVSLAAAKRYGTAAKVAMEAFPEGAETAVLVTGKNFPDALAANAYAGALNAPILLTQTDHLSPDTRKLLVEDWGGCVKNVTVIGGTLEEQVYQDLVAIGIDGERIRTIAGPTRYATANQVCQDGLDTGLFTPDTVFIATGGKAADALAAASWSYQLKWPILLAKNGQVNADTAALVRRFNHVILLGGEDSVTEEAACRRFHIRLSGNNRYQTACDIADYFVSEGYGSYNNTAFADGTDDHFSDALTAGMLQGKWRAPILLTKDQQKDTRNFIYDYVKADETASQFYFIGYDAEGNGPAYDQITFYLKSSGWLDIDTARAGTVVAKDMIDTKDMNRYFHVIKINTGDAVYHRIVNKSYSPSGRIALSDLRYLKVLHYNFDGKIQVGELICNAAIANIFISVFKELYAHKYEIKQMRLIDDFWTGDGLSTDEASIEADNTSCFCYRQATGAVNLSNHAWGRAIDINPIENPYVYVTPNGKYSTHAASAPYVENRDPSVPHVITTSDTAYKILTAHGFTWGGFFTTDIDYQHFDKLT